MLPYIMLSLAPLIWGFIGSALYPNSDLYWKRRKFITIATGICLFLMIALRSKDLGSTDSDQYYNLWKSLSGLSFDNFVFYVNNSRLEFGFLSVTWILSSVHIFSDPQFIFVFSGLLFSICIGKFIYENCDDVILSWTMFITLGLYTFMVQGLRQAIAISICISSISLCKERKFAKFLILVLIASLFHKTALVFLAVYFLYNRKMNSNSLLILLSVLIAVIGASQLILSVGNNLFGMNYEGAVDSGGFVAVAIYVITLLLAWLFRGESQEDPDYCFFFYLTFIGFAIYLLRYFGALALERISFYFMIGQIVSLPASLRHVSKGKQIMILGIWFLSIMLFIYRIDGSSLIPYRFFWN